MSHQMGLNRELSAAPREEPLQLSEYRNRGVSHNKLRSASREIVLAAVMRDGLLLQYASDELRADKKVVLAAVQQNGVVLWYASDTVKNDREVVLAAVQQNGVALWCASDELKNDEEVVLAAENQLKQDS